MLPGIVPASLEDAERHAGTMPGFVLDSLVARLYISTSLVP